MKNKFRQNIVIGVIAIVGTMGYNLSINQENENVRLITGGLDCNYNRHPSQCEIYVGAKGKVKLLGGSIISAGVDGYVRFDGQVACSRGGDFACTPIECKELYEIIF